MARSNGALPGLNVLVPLATIVLLVVVLRYAQDVLVPLCLAVLLTFILSPLAKWLEAVGVWRIPSVIIVSVLFVAATGALGWLVGRQIVSVGSNLPAYRENIESKLRSLESGKGAKIKGILDSVDQIQSEILGGLNRQSPRVPETGTTTLEKSGASSKHPRPVVVESPSASRSTVTALLGPVLGPITRLGIALVLVVFMLASRETLRNRVFRLVGRGRLTMTTRAFDEAAGRVSRYLIFQSIVNVCYGVLIAVGLHLLKIPNPILWGALSGLLRYLPYIGPIIATAMPTLLAIGAFPDWHHALYVLGLYVAVEIATANFIEPTLYSAKTGITALSILIAAIFWGIIWGPVGLILSTPLTVCLVAFGKHIPQLEFLTILFGDETQLSPEVNLYQRLLADDPEEARDIAEQYLEQNSVAELYDSILIPALILAEQDHEREALDQSRKTRLLENVREIIEDLSEAPNHLAKHASAIATATVPGQTPGARILAVPARDQGDEIAAFMLAQLLGRGGCHIDAIPAAPLKQTLQNISDRAPAVLCISALPPVGARQARALYRKVKNQSKDMKVIVGMWRANGVVPSMYDWLGLAQSDRVVTSLADCAYQVHTLCEDPTQDAPSSPPGVRK